jgi:hypothetical protein
VQQLGLDATQRRKSRGAAERRFGDLSGEWQRDEEPYPRRLEPCGGEPYGLSFVGDELRDEHHSEKTAKGGEGGRAKALALRDAFPCVSDQCSHYSLLCKQAACRMLLLNPCYLAVTNGPEDSAASAERSEAVMQTLETRIVHIGTRSRVRRITPASALSRVPFPFRPSHVPLAPPLAHPGASCPDRRSTRRPADHHQAR